MRKLVKTTIREQSFVSIEQLATTRAEGASHVARQSGVGEHHQRNCYARFTKQAHYIDTCELMQSGVGPALPCLGSRLESRSSPVASRQQK